LYDVQPLYRYDGWWGRFDSRYPFVLPIHERLGGDEKFRWFLNENAKDGRTVILHANPVQYDTDAEAFNPEHMAKDRNGQFAGVSVWSGNQLVIASPRFALADNVAVLNELRDWGTTGVFWDVL